MLYMLIYTLRSLECKRAQNNIQKIKNYPQCLSFTTQQATIRLNKQFQKNVHLQNDLEKMERERAKFQKLRGKLEKVSVYNVIENKDLITCM